MRALVDLVDKAPGDEGVLEEPARDDECAGADDAERHLEIETGGTLVGYERDVADATDADDREDRERQTADETTQRFTTESFETNIAKLHSFIAPSSLAIRVDHTTKVQEARESTDDGEEKTDRPLQDAELHVVRNGEGDACEKAGDAKDLHRLQASSDHLLESIRQTLRVVFLLLIFTVALVHSFPSSFDLQPLTML